MKRFGDLFIIFKNAKHTEGEPTEDGKVIVHYDKEKNIAAVEIQDITTIQQLTRASRL